MAGPSRFLIVCAMSAISVRAVDAQIVRGSVIEDRTRLPVAGAEVTLLTGEEGRPPSTTTDSVGEFRIRAPRAGTYGLRVVHSAYRTRETPGVEVAVGETVTLEIRVSASAIPLETIVVTARSSTMPGFDRRRETGFGRFLVREDIEARAASRTTDLLRGVSGLTLMPVRRGRRSLLFMRSGLGLCEPAIWVDGNRVTQSPSSTLDDFVLPETIEGVEVYRSSAEAPVQYVGGPCGVVLIWTRRGSGDDGDPWSWQKLLIGAGGALTLILFFIN